MIMINGSILDDDFLRFMKLITLIIGFNKDEFWILFGYLVTLSKI